jgi:hypothetical protein
MLQFKRGKAAIEQAARLSHFLLLEKPFRLSLSGRWAFNSPFLFEQLSLISFYLFGSGSSGLGDKEKILLTIQTDPTMRQRWERYCNEYYYAKGIMLID